MALGKAFIEVHADTRPFARQLGRDLDAVLKDAEKDIRASSRKVGDTISTEAGKGVKRSGKKITTGVDKAVTDTLNSGVFGKLAKGVIDTIDDGLSGLPAEVKLALGAALVASLPFAIAFGSAIAAAITAGLTLIGGIGLGALLASQFTEVREAAQDTFSYLRTQFLQTAEPLVRPFLNALRLVRERLTTLQPELVNLFLRIGDTAVPIADAFVGAVEEFVPAFRRGFANIGEFLAPLQIGLRGIGRAAGEFFEVILNNPNADEAFFDILDVVHRLITAFTELVDWGLDFYGVLRDIAEAVGLVEPYEQTITRLGRQIGIATEEQSLFGDIIAGTIEPLDAETEAIDELNQAITLLTRLTTNAISNEIAFQQGIDDLTESIKENKDTLDLHGQAGRDNANVLLDLAQTILETRQNTIDLTGNVAAAEAAFNAQREEVYRVARQMGLTKTEVDGVIGALLAIPAPRQAGVTENSLDRLEDFNRALRNTIYLQSLIDPTYNPQGPGGQQRFAHGGIVTGPTNALIGEAGDEVVIPLSRPARAAQLLNESGLSSMMSPTVNVYIGNQQIDAYIATQTNRQLAMSARAMNYGTRGI